MERVILHSDMNNFYASVECMLNPELKAYPIAVCGDVEERHGIVLAKNYKAKAKGVSTGEAIWQAKQKCPGLLIVSPHYDEYMKYSKKARAIYGRYTDEIEPFGMDECWLDVSGSTRAFGSGEKIANEIKEAIKFELQDLEDSVEVWKFILELSQDIGHRLFTFNKKATGVAISVRDNELFTKQWQCKIPLSTQSPSVIAREAFSLFEKNYSWKHPIRSITVRAINLVSLDYDEQISLFYDAEKSSRIEALDKAVEEIRSRYGYNAIKNATLLQNPKMPSHNSPKLIMPTGVPQ